MKKSNPKKPTRILTKQVAWKDDEPIKYQSYLEHTIGERTIRILSSPMPTAKESVDDLLKEFYLWEEAIAEFRKVIEEKNEVSN